MGKTVAHETPRYKSPPVVETVLGVQFPELGGFRSVHFGRYWETIKSRFPKFDDKPRLPEVREVFPRNLTAPSPKFTVTDRPSPDRVWYRSDAGDELIQLQPDRFLFNWRKREEEQPYQIYDTTKTKFFDEFRSFGRFCTEAGLEMPSPNLCEVSYINHLFPEDTEEAVDLLATALVGLSWEHADQWLPKPEGATLNRVYPIEADGNKIGRLYAEASLACQSEDSEPREFVLLRLTARVLHPSEAASAVEDSMRIAHNWVVQGFASITDTGVQRARWGRLT